MMHRLRTGVLAGLGYGLAVAIVDLGFGTWNFVQKNLPAFTESVAQSSVIQIVLGAVLGAATFLLRSRDGGGALLQLGAVTALWLLVACWTAVDRAIVPMWASPAVGGLLLVLAARVIGRRRPALPIAIGVGALAALCFLPRVWQAFHDEDYAARQRPSARLLAAGEPQRPDVVVVVLDTVRAQSMSAYGYGLRTTPVFDDLAADGALFLDASAPATWSLPSHASLFTGLFPSVHGAHEENLSLDASRPTMAGLLADAGWQTVAFTANPWISDHLGLTRGFQWSDEAWRTGGGGRAFFFAFRLLDKLGFGADDKGGAVVAGNFEDWVATRPDNAQPAFAFLNFLEAHFPHHQLPEDVLARFTSLPSADLHEHSRRLFATQFGAPLSEIEVAETRRPAREMYDAGVAYTDELLGRIVEALRRRGSLDRTLLVVLADHGELLGEHGEFGHGPSLFQPTMRVPLLVRLPGVVRASRVETAVSTTAVLATVLDALDLDANATPGIVASLLPVLEGRPGGAPVLAERYGRDADNGRKHPLLRSDVRLRAYRSGPLKFVQTSKGQDFLEDFLFDLADDPDELRNVAAERPADLARVKGELETWRAAMGIPPLDAEVATGAAPVGEMDPEVQEKLRALGYVE
ncbi:MAG: sulfatase [Candidatus Binatia bacterium]